MVVDDPHVVGVASPPHEADPPPFVDAHAVLSNSITPELLETIAGRDAQIIHSVGGVKDDQLAVGYALQISWQSTRSDAPEDVLGFWVGEGSDHLTT
jgi:hypothetical protein